jgi:hypothetical protein
MTADATSTSPRILFISKLIVFPLFVVTVNCKRKLVYSQWLNSSHLRRNITQLADNTFSLLSVASTYGAKAARDARSVRVNVIAIEGCRAKARLEFSPRSECAADA